jgi:hypothetical protein
MSIESFLFAVSIFCFCAAGFYGLVFVAIFIRPRVFMGIGLVVSAAVFLFSPSDAVTLFIAMSCACLLCQCHKAAC